MFMDTNLIISILSIAAALIFGIMSVIIGILSLVIGILALVVALVMPTLPEIIWGRPKLKVISTGFAYAGLFCRIKNCPVEDWQAKIGVRRQDIRDLRVRFEIHEKTSGKCVFQAVEDRDLNWGDFDTNIGKHATLPPSMTWITVTIVKNEPAPLSGDMDADFFAHNKTVVIPFRVDNDYCSLDKFGPGTYAVHIAISLDHKWEHYAKDFVVSEEYPFSKWDGNTEEINKVQNVKKTKDHKA